MNVRDKINELTSEYKASLAGMVDGGATIEQQNETMEILDLIGFYTRRLMLFGNDEIEGTGDTDDWIN